MCQPRWTGLGHAGPCWARLGQVGPGWAGLVIWAINRVLTKLASFPDFPDFPDQTRLTQPNPTRPSQARQPLVGTLLELAKQPNRANQASLQHAHVRPGSCAPRAHVELGPNAALFPEMMPTIDAVLMPRGGGHGGDHVELVDH